MDALADAYDEAMLDVIAEWEDEADPYLGVIWQPGSAIHLEEWPEEGLSGVDCFHPSVEAHKRVGAGYWNRLTLSLVSVQLARGRNGLSAPKVRGMYSRPGIKVGAV